MVGDSAIKTVIGRRSTEFSAALLVGACLAISTASQAAPVTVFTTDFNAGASAEFSGITATESVQGFAAHGFSGQFLRNTTSSSVTRLTLNGLPSHTGIEINFLLAIIDSWDGDTNLGGSAPVDRFHIAVNGSSVYAESFDNFNTADQTAPITNQIVSGVDLGFTGVTFGGLNVGLPGEFWGNLTFFDAAYDMGSPVAGLDSIAHTSSTLTIDFSAPIQGGSDESWAIDNLEIILHGVGTSEPSEVPEPMALTLLGTGFLGLAWARRRTRKVQRHELEARWHED
ncbi:MAG: PEP-CTERM sorting domain-containing protein [Alphaproteobacteria bacterium]|jgi:hypothetical protein|nr:PEP-CTERM sorting domain-containing protein [Alphaproteobacteria bacterium]MDP6812827.1 PEP-CTERM sorting domain-containing protein [Alphaproteobacteria bacterium]